MTTEIGALRRAFETYINPDADVNLHWLAAGYYAGRGVQQSWLDFQAGHAAGVADERERCAQLCDKLSRRAGDAMDCRDAIRAGAKEPSDADQA